MVRTDGGFNLWYHIYANLYNFPTSWLLMVFSNELSKQHLFHMISTYSSGSIMSSLPKPSFTAFKQEPSLKIPQLKEESAKQRKTTIYLCCCVSFSRIAFSKLL